MREQPVNGACEVTFPGTSTASGSLLRSISCALVDPGATRLMTDAGIGVLRQVRGVGVSPYNPGAVLLTHWRPPGPGFRPLVRQLRPCVRDFVAQVGYWDESMEFVQ